MDRQSNSSGSLNDYIPLSSGRSNGGERRRRSSCSESYTLLQLAAWNGHADSVKTLLAAHVDVHKPTLLRQQSPLMLASRRGHAEVMSLLIEHGANIQQRAADKSTGARVAELTAHASIDDFRSRFELQICVFRSSFD